MRIDYNPAMTQDQCPYVSRGGLKLAAALDGFSIDPASWVCADLGCNVGGFTDCLLQRGATKVYAVDTGYGELAWTLRNDGRVVVMERTNALHCQPPELVDLVVLDVAWTPQGKILPAAARWLKPGGQIVSLVKTHYEAAKRDPAYQKRKGGAKTPHLDDETSRSIFQAVCDDIRQDGFEILNTLESPVRGKGGGLEFLVLTRIG
jgi:23S rRNA (cytidine1920-2'-O)/16S rRNA (cytidine1409-2'-O)-methyltransferase